MSRAPTPDWFNCPQLDWFNFPELNQSKTNHTLQPEWFNLEDCTILMVTYISTGLVHTPRMNQSKGHDNDK